MAEANAYTDQLFAQSILYTDAQVAAHTIAVVDYGLVPDGMTVALRNNSSGRMIAAGSFMMTLPDFEPLRENVIYVSIQVLANGAQTWLGVFFTPPPPLPIGVNEVWLKAILLFDGSVRWAFDTILR